MRPRNLYLIATGSWFAAFGMQSVVFAWLVTIVLEQPDELVGWAQTALLIPGMLLKTEVRTLTGCTTPDFASST